MSFVCPACGRQRAGANDWICRECEGTQMGEVGKLLARFKNRKLDRFSIQELEDELDVVPDGSITNRRRDRVVKLIAAARAFNEALDTAIPQSHQEDW